MNSLEQNYGSLFDGASSPCISLYQPTHRHHPDNAQDPIRFRNLVDSLKESLGRKYDKADIDSLLQPFVSLAEDTAFWKNTLDGLAVLASPELFRVYRLQRRVPELAVVADTVHLKPLHRFAQSADRFQVLGLSRDAIRLYEGNRDVVDEVEPAEGVPRTIVEALGGEITEPHMTVASYGGLGPGMHHGHGAKKDEVEIDAERFFRSIDRAVHEHHSRPSGLPLVLAGLPENQSVFRAVSRNPLLVDEGIDSDPQALATDALRERAWRILEPRYLERLDRFVEQFRAAQARGLGSDDLDEIAAAAVAGRVATLIVEAEREIAGRVDPQTGGVARDDLAHPEVDDVLDDLGSLVVKRGGEWIIVPKERMPTNTGMAAVYRY